MEEPLISVALCTYNGEKYIGEQVDSIINQTYKNFELIVVDDGSTDGTFDIINNYANRDNRIKCYKNETNLGFNKNFERAMALTSGDYIAISDQDDIWLPEKLRILSDNIKDNWLVFSNSAYLGSNKSGKLLTDFKLPIEYKGILLRNYVTGHTTLLKRGFLNYALPFPQKGYYDWWMGFVAAYHHKITFVDEVLTNYRVHDESVIKKRQDLGRHELEEFETITVMLKTFAGYENLEPADKIFIHQLEAAYQLKGSLPSSIQLTKMVYKYYRELFPNQKPRKLLSKLNFAIRFSKGVQTDK